MTDASGWSSLLRQHAAEDIAETIAELILHAPDEQLNRINPLRFAMTYRFDASRCIAAFLHATRLGLFEMSWNVVCGSCGGVLNSTNSLRSIEQPLYRCALCALDCEPNLDETVEITFTVDSRIRRIAAHDPDKLPLWSYARQIFWSSGSDLPEDLGDCVKEAVLDTAEIPPMGQAALTLQLDHGTAIVFDPVTHSSQYLQIEGPPANEQQELALAIDETNTWAMPVRIAPGRLRLSLENRTSRKVLPIIWRAGDALKDMVSRRIPVLSAKRLLTHQTFRETHRAGILDVEQCFKITSLTFLFMDLRGSTALYEMAGDLGAYDFVRSYFQHAQDVIADHGGAVVKTIGDAVMATFAEPVQAIRAATATQKAMDDLNSRRSDGAQFVRIGIHLGPCLAVLVNDRQDYFGQTVNIASRLQNISDDRIVVTSSVVEDQNVRELIIEAGLEINSFRTRLRGLTEETTLYRILF